MKFAAMQKELVYRLEEIESAAKVILELSMEVNVLAFHADMGAGKTTLIAKLVALLGSEDVVGSPTFSIINQYQTGGGQTIYHMDWYRLKDEEEAIQAGVEDALYSGNLCLVEWPDRAGSLLPDDTLHLYIDTIDETTRSMKWG